MRYYEMSSADISGECPLYKRCRTGQALSSRACTGSRCNTFYRIDTIELYLNSPWGPKAIANCGTSEEDSGKKSDVARIVEEHLTEMNRKGHAFEGNGKPKRISTIAAGFSK